MSQLRRPVVFCWLLILFAGFPAVAPTAEPAERGGRVELTAPERQWLAEHPVIRVGPDPDFQPVESLDENGRLVGVAADYLKVLEEKLGIRFEIVPVANWDEAVRMAKSRQVDMFSAATKSASRSEYMSFTTPHIVLPGVIIVQNKAGNISGLDQLRGKKVGVVSNYVWQEWIERDHAGIDLQPVRDTQTGLLLVSFGQLDAMVGNLATATHFLEKLGITNLRVAAETGYYASLAIATRNDWPELNAILQKALSAIGPEQNRAIHNRWISLGSAARIDTWTILLVVLIVIAVAAAALAGIFLWNYSLRKEVRRQSESLRQSEQRFRAISETIPIGIIIARASDGEIIYCNPRIAELSGLSIDALTGRRTLDFYENLDDRAMILEGLRKDGRFVAHDIMLKRVGGPPWPGDLFSHAIQFFGEGAVLTAVIDVTEAKKAERLLKDSERKFRDLIEGSVQGIFIHQNGRIVYANKACSDMFGLHPDETIGHDIMTLIADVDVERMRERQETRRRGKDLPQHSEFEMKRGDGSIFSVVSLSRDIEWEGTPAVQVTVVDITEQKRAERALRDSEQQLRVITDSLPVLIGHIDAGERYRFLNKTAEKWHDRPAEELYGKTLKEVLPKPFYALNAPRFKAALSGERVNFEDQLDFPNGDKRHISGTYVPHIDEDGTVVGFFALGQNVTRQKETEAQLRQAQKMEAVGQLTGGVAHDFNNLLTVIRGNLEMIEESLRDRPELHRMSERAIAASDRAGILTQRLLAFSRKQALSPRRSNLNRLVAGMDDLLRRTMSAEIEIKVIPARGLWRCEIDLAQMENALLNLVVNASDAMPAGGRLTIETANTTVPREDIDAAAGVEVPAGQYVTITVTDTGQGMSPEIAAQAFEPFFTTKEVGKGSGLGLSMVYGFVKQSGGHVRIDSEKGRGSSFRIFLPRFESGAPRRNDEPAAAEIPRGRGQTVLLVEDDSEVRRLVGSMLEGLGYRVVEADCGPAALDLLDGLETLDLLLTDVVLPSGMDGREMAEETCRRRPEVRVLYMSGYTDGGIVHQGRLDEDATLLRKPFRKSEVARAVRDSLAGGA